MRSFTSRLLPESYPGSMVLRDRDGLGVENVSRVNVAPPSIFRVMSVELISLAGSQRSLAPTLFA